MGSHRVPVKGVLAGQDDSWRGDSVTVAMCSETWPSNSPHCTLGNSQNNECIHTELSTLPQVGVCDEERLSGEGGGHPVISHHQAERCHADQQLWDWASPVEPGGLRYTSQCELAYFCTHFICTVYMPARPNVCLSIPLLSAVTVNLSFSGLDICLHTLANIEGCWAVIHLTFCSSIELSGSNCVL